MIHKAEYDTVVESLTTAGYFHNFRIDPRYGYEMICTAGRYEEGRLYGRSFWLCRSANRKCWLIFEMGGSQCWRIPEDNMAIDVCLACLKEMGPCMDIPESVVEKYHLIKIDLKEIRGFDFADGDGNRPVSVENEVVLTATASDGAVVQQEAMSYEDYKNLSDDPQVRARLGIRKEETRFYNHNGELQATYEHYYDESGAFERGRNTYADGTVTEHTS